MSIAPESPRSRRWPLLLILPALAVVAWPRPPAPRHGHSAGEEPLRVAYPQVRILSAAELEGLRGRCLVLDVLTDAEGAREALAARSGAPSRELRVVFRAPRARAEEALQAALRARVAGYEKACAYLVD